MTSKTTNRCSPYISIERRSFSNGKPSTAAATAMNDDNLKIGI